MQILTGTFWWLLKSCSWVFDLIILMHIFGRNWKVPSPLLIIFHSFSTATLQTQITFAWKLIKNFSIPRCQLCLMQNPHTRPRPVRLGWFFSRIPAVPVVNLWQTSGFWHLIFIENQRNSFVLKIAHQSLGTMARGLQNSEVPKDYFLFVTLNVI